MAKEFISVERTVSPRPRSKRRRESGAVSGGGSVTVIQNGSGDSHANRSALDQISTDGDGYQYLTRYAEVTDPDTGDTSFMTVKEKVKAGYADTAHDLTANSPIRTLYLSRTEDDVAGGRITFARGLTSVGAVVFQSGAAIFGDAGITGSLHIGGGTLRWVPGAEEGDGYLEFSHSVASQGSVSAGGIGSGGGNGGGSVTSIGMTVPQGFTVSPSSISQSGTFAVGFASGYSLPSNNLQASWTAKQDAIGDLATIRQNAANGNTAYGWGNHANAGYLTQHQSLAGYALTSWVEQNWLVKDFSSVDIEVGGIINGDFIPAYVGLENGVLTVENCRLAIDVPYYTSELENDSGFITSSALRGYATETWVGSNYLRLTGGTMTGSLTIGNVTIYGTGSNGGVNSILIGDDAYIGDGNLAGGIGIKAKNSNVQAGIKFFTNEGKSCGELLARADKNLTYEGNLIWHEGNDGSGSGLDADLLDGYHANGLFTSFIQDSVSISATIGGVTKSIQAPTVSFLNNHSEAQSSPNIPTTKFSGTKFGTSTGLYLTGTYLDSSTPCNYGNILNIIGAGAGQLLAEWCGGYVTGHLFYRSHRDNNSTGGWSPWKTIAFIDDNVASATHATSAGSADTLTTARRLWGEPFDGSGDVSGSLTGVIDIHLTGQLQHDNAWYFGPGAGDGSGFYNLYRTGVGFVYRTNPADGIVTYCQGLAVASGRSLTLNGQEYNAICNVANANGAITVNRFENATAIRNALSFKWYDTDWQIGNIRGGATNSQGFGVTKNNDTLVFAINETRAYIPGSVGIGTPSPTYKLDVAGTLRATSNILTNGYVQIGNARLVWDSANNAIRVEGVSGAANLYATGGLASLGIGGGSSGSVTNLTVTDTLRIKAGSSGYHSIKNKSINGNNYLRLSGDSGICLDNDTVIDGTLSVDGVGGLHVEDGVEAYGNITAGGDLTVGGDVKVDYNGDTYRLNVQAAINAGILTQVTA